MALAIEEGTDYRQLVVEHDALFSLLDQDGRGSNLWALGNRRVFYAATIDGRAKRAWRAHNGAEREAASEAERARAADDPDDA